MYGAIIGDLAGSRHEHAGTKRMDFPFPDERSFLTDDSILTAATAEAILEGSAGYPDYGAAYAKWALRYPNSGYGGSFRDWIDAARAGRTPPAYGSFGNGSAMRVSPVGWLFETEAEVLEHAEASAAVTHDHPEGIKGAQAVALAVFRARTEAAAERGNADVRTAPGTPTGPPARDASLDDAILAAGDRSGGPAAGRADHDGARLATDIAKRFGYELPDSLDEFRETYTFDVTCQGTLPAALACVRDATDFEHSIRLAVSLGGDADTLACIVGSICEPLFGGVPSDLRRFARAKMPVDIRRIADTFDELR